MAKKLTFQPSTFHSAHLKAPNFHRFSEKIPKSSKTVTNISERRGGRHGFYWAKPVFFIKCVLIKDAERADEILENVLTSSAGSDAVPGITESGDAFITTGTNAFHIFISLLVLIIPLLCYKAINCFHFCRAYSAKYSATLSHQVVKIVKRNINILLDFCNNCHYN